MNLRTWLRALPFTLLPNAAIIYLFLFNEQPFEWLNLLKAVFYALILSLTFWGGYALMTRSMKAE